MDVRKLADNYSPDFGLDWVPVISPEVADKMPLRELYEYHKARKYAEELAENNPTGAGWRLPAWKTVMQTWRQYAIHVILGGNRSTKSTLASRLCVWGTGTIPEAEVKCFHVNQDRSQQDQQKLIWDALPQSIKSMPVKKGQYHSIAWNQRTGFTNDICILPPLPGWKRGGRIDFTNYKSYENDNQVAEGFKSHIMWLDEEAPVKLFNTLKYRTTDYHGRIIVTFTTLDGWTPLVQEILGKTKTLEWRNAPLLNNKRIPVLQESLSCPGAIIHYFWSEDNPFIDSEEFRKKLIGRAESDILCRAYGIPTKTASAVFTKFDRGVNVVKHEDLPFIKNPNYPVTRYMIMDPGGSKNDFIGWVAIDAAGTYWCYREWPDYDTYGAWAEPGPNPNGKAGPAQKSLGYGIKEMVETIKTLEGDEVIFERLIDPRMGAAERKGEDGATTLISDYDNHDMTLIPAPGVDIKNGISLINGLLAWDEKKPRDSKNSPRIYFSERCENWIHMMSEWTNYSPTEHTKEGPDLLRYLVTSSPRHFKPEDMRDTGTTGSY